MVYNWFAEPFADSERIALLFGGMHGLVFRRSIHYWQDQPGRKANLRGALFPRSSRVGPFTGRPNDPLLKPTPSGVGLFTRYRPRSDPLLKPTPFEARRDCSLNLLGVGAVPLAERLAPGYLSHHSSGG